MRALLLLLALAGCSDIPRAHSENAIREMAREESARIANTVDHNAAVANERASEVEELRRRVEKLERDNRELEQQVGSLRRELLL